MTSVGDFLKRQEHLREANRELLRQLCSGAFREYDSEEEKVVAAATNVDNADEMVIVSKKRQQPPQPDEDKHNVKGSGATMKKRTSKGFHNDCVPKDPSRDFIASPVKLPRSIRPKKPLKGILKRSSSTSALVDVDHDASRSNANQQECPCCRFNTMAVNDTGGRKRYEPQKQHQERPSTAQERHATQIRSRKTNVYPETATSRMTTKSSKIGFSWDQAGDTVASCNMCHCFECFEKFSLKRKQQAEAALASKVHSNQGISFNHQRKTNPNGKVIKPPPPPATARTADEWFEEIVKYRKNNFWDCHSQGTLLRNKI